MSSQADHLSWNKHKHNHNILRNDYILRPKYLTGKQIDNPALQFCRLGVACMYDLGTWNDHYVQTRLLVRGKLVRVSCQSDNLLSSLAEVQVLPDVGVNDCTHSSVHSCVHLVGHFSGSRLG